MAERNPEIRKPEISLPLFEQECQVCRDDKYRAPEQARARRSDPQTSKDAAASRQPRPDQRRHPANPSHVWASNR